MILICKNFFFKKNFLSSYRSGSSIWLRPLGRFMGLSFFKAILLAVFFFIFLPVFSFAEKSSVQQLKKEVDAILRNSCLAEGSVGIEVYSLAKENVLYEKNSNRFFIPASNIKLLTSAVVLKALGGEYQFLTTVSTDGEIKKGILNGNLYLKGFGDPRLVSEELWMIVKNIRNLGIKKINGNIIADDTYFDDKRTTAGVSKNSGPEPYNARVSALSLNFNTVTVYISPAEKVGDPPIVTVDPPTQYIKVSNKAKTASRKKRKKLIVDRAIGNGYDTVIVKGSVNVSGYHTYLNISNPTLYTITVFKEFLEKDGIKVSGTISIAKQPENVKELAIHKSRPLALIIQDMNKISNNFISEQVLKTAGAERFGPPGTTQKGLDLIDQFMKSMSYSSSSYSIVDGSGLSKQNRLSPDQIVSVLKMMFNDFSVKSEYVSSLGIMGIDGSLKKRLNEFSKKRYIRAKTGTLNGANSLSGYIGTEDGEELAFSILINSKKCSWKNVTNIQNNIVSKLATFSRTETNNNQKFTSTKKKRSGTITSQLALSNK